jgi:TrmH family RNA methyltransferase
MITKAEINLIRSLGDKRNRAKYGVFVVEGIKSISEMSQAGLEMEALYTTTDSTGKMIKPSEMERISALKSPTEHLALFRIPKQQLNSEQVRSDITLVLDDVQDPGNLGTIIRLADWFGIKQIVCSPATADAFNPKTIQSTMGAIARVNVYYTPLDTFFEQFNDIPCCGTFLDGENIYSAELPQPAIIVMGNEGNGISDKVSEFVNKRITIPPYPLQSNTVESLNVAMATAIVCAEFRRRLKK